MSADGISAVSLTKRYGRQTVVDNVHLTIPKGRIVGLLGPNGVGKTTTLKMMVGLVRPTRGQILITGADPLRNPSARASLGALIDQPSYYPNLTGRENLWLFARKRGLPAADIPTTVNEILGIVGLDETASRLAVNYSLDMKQRLGIGITLIGKPEFLILDEPQNGLDPIAAASMRELLIKLNALGHTLIISSHLLPEVERLALLILVMVRGRLAFQGTMEELRRQGQTLEAAFISLAMKGGVA